MKKYKLRKVTVLFSLLCMICTVFGSSQTAFAYTSSEGWKSVIDQEFNGVRVIVSTPHEGWASPEATWCQHVNLLLQVNGSETRNYHIYNKKSANGKNCIKAYETHQRVYFQFSKCHDDTNKAIKEILEKNGCYSLAESTSKDAGGLLTGAAIVAAVILIAKIVASILTANPAPMLIPV